MSIQSKNSPKSAETLGRNEKRAERQRKLAAEREKRCQERVFHYLITNLVHETGMDWTQAHAVCKKQMEDVWPEVMNFKENRRLVQPIHDTIGDD